MNFVKLDPQIPDFLRKSAGAAAYDLYARPNPDRPMGRYELRPGETAKIGCGIAVEIPENHCGLVLIRGGHGIKQGLLIHVGLIDEDYRGELFTLVHRPLLLQDVKDLIAGHDPDPLFIQPYERFAQLLILPYAALSIQEMSGLSTTTRGADWGSSTGLS